jgi:diguanylate cyclase
MTRWLWRWWRQSDRFDWFAHYLEDRQLRHVAQASIAAITAAFSAVAAALLWSPAGPHGPWAKISGAMAAIVGAALAAFWLFRWPTLVQSRLYAFLGTACVAVGCLSQSDPLVGLTGCYAFVVSGTYIAVMHCAKATIYNFVVSLGLASVLTWQVGHRGGDIVLAGCELSLLALFSVGAPVALQTMLHIMAGDILRSDRDALTGLLNRHGFYRQTSRLIDRCVEEDAGHLAITMIDLDQFKQVNDNYGHPAGDQALIDVGEVLRATSGASAVVARAGGEEFLLAEVCITGKWPAAARLCAAIAGTSHGITASLGTTSMPVSWLKHRDTTNLIDGLIFHADRAMYAAKKAGGNQCRHYRLPPQPHPLNVPEAEHGTPQLSVLAENGTIGCPGSQASGPWIASPLRSGDEVAAG